MDVGASEIAVEGFAARETYRRVVNDALRRAKLNRPIRVSTWPPKGSGRGGGDAIARSAALIQGLETGTTRIAGHLPGLEGVAVTWQAGQHQPDALAALVVAHDVLVHAAGQQWGFASPIDAARRAHAGRMPPRLDDPPHRRLVATLSPSGTAGDSALPPDVAVAVCNRCRPPCPATQQR